MPTADLVREAAPRTATGPVLAVIAPAFNERGNVALLADKVGAALAGIDWELIIVDDDSPDGTAEAVRALTAADARVRCIQRIGRRGLASAVVEGCLASSAPYLACIDADLQHDETRLPLMLAKLRDGSADLVVGTRFSGGGTTGDFAAQRVSISRLGARLSRLIVKTDVSDPMSGFFMLTRPAFDRAVRGLSSDGFKILLDVLASAPGLRVAEVPYVFGSRLHGDSKLDGAVLWEFLVFIAARLTGNRLPASFISFGIIGASGVATQSLAFVLLFKALGVAFTEAEAISIGIAMLGNFLLNNALTYRDRRYRGWALVPGFASYAAVCGLGAIANIGVASYLFKADTHWWPAMLAGIIVGTVWNYVASRWFTWAKRRA